nr:IS3 family transposase [Leisingera sp. JC1]
MIEPANANLPIGKQCKLLSIPRSSFYYQPKGETALNLALMRLIDEQFLETPFFGVRQMTWHLRNEGHLVNEKRIRRLMRLMGLMPIYQKPNTSKAAKGHKTYEGGRSPTGGTRPPLRPFLGSVIAAGPLRWWFSGMENHLCAGAPCNRSSDETFHEAETRPPHRSRRGQGRDEPGDRIPYFERSQAALAEGPDARAAAA